MTWEIHGIPHPADTEYLEAESRKSTLLLEAKFMREHRQDDEAIHRYAEAARIESVLAERCDKQGYPASALLHRYSAVACWSGSGNYYQALLDAEVLLEQPDLPESMRTKLETFVQNLRNKLRQWYEEEVQRSVAVGA